MGDYGGVPGLVLPSLHPGSETLLPGQGTALQNSVLLLDNAPGHPPHLDDFHPDVKVVYLPPNTTSLIQPMGQGVIATFKRYYTRRVVAEYTGRP